MNGGIFYSSNNGANWIAQNNGLTNLTVMNLLVSGNNIFAGTYGGIFLLTNNGANWVNKNQGLNYIPYIYSLIIYNNNIFAGTNGFSVWRRSLSEILGVQNISTEIPSSYTLGQNFPNPFNPMTVIRFNVSGFHVKTSGNDKVVLKVYDVMGREVQTLVNERLNAGTYEVSFDGSMLTSGVYFYRLITNGFSDTKKMLLIK
jgi:hypothetical protein